jgi:hypothetical protein
MDDEDVEKYYPLEDWSKVDRYECDFFLPDTTAARIEFRNDQGEFKIAEPLETVLQRNREGPRCPKWVLSDPDDWGSAVPATVYLGDAMRKVTICLGRFRGFRVEPTKADHWGQWT